MLFAPHANNNPVKYNDPSGHDVGCAGKSAEECGEKGTRTGWPPKRTSRLSQPAGKGLDLLGENILDWIPVISDVRHIVRGGQAISWASSQPGFDEQQAALQDWYHNCYGVCHGAEPIPGVPLGGPMPDVPLVDIYSQGMGEAASGAADLLMTYVGAKAFEVRPFTKPKPDWHLGLEYGAKMSIVHVGNKTGRGIHIAFGSVAPNVGDLHIYMYPDVYLWRPAWGPKGEIFLWSWIKK